MLHDDGNAVPFLIERDKDGEPTGMLLAKPNATLLYATLARGPRLSPNDQMNSTRANFVEEVLAPRVARFGVRLNF